MIRTMASALACGVCIVALATPAQAQTRDYSIPAGSLKSALDAYARQSGRQVIYKSDEIRGVRSRGANGAMAADVALAAILGGSGFRAQADSSGAVAIVRANVATQSSGEAASSRGEEEGNPTSDEIIVTGSNIRGRVPTGTSVRQIDREEIARSGYTRVEELIQSLPQNFRGGAAGATADANFSGGSAAGSNSSFGSGVNLRGLGANATLVLINGHRVASSGNGFFTDISSIPLSAIERIEVLTDGASAIYGSDAIAGVVNIILRRDGDGVETGLRFGSTTQSGFAAYGANVRLANSWNGGSISLDADFSKEGSLRASERDFTASIPDPITIFPSFKQASISSQVRQRLSSAFEVHADGQYSNVRRVGYLPGSTATQFIQQIPRVERWGGSAGFSYQLGGDWIAKYDFSLGRESNDVSAFNYTSGSVTDLSVRSQIKSRFSENNAGISGTLIELPAGPLKAAVGLVYRKESFSQANRNATASSELAASRDVTAAYAELRLPVFSQQNAIAGFHSLTLSGAVRYDHYSDFGNTVNPKFGVSWFPVPSLQLRGAYSTSFRAPAAGSELVNAQKGILTGVFTSFPNPAGTAQVPVLFIVGAQQNLKAETANNLTFGADYEPEFAPRLKLSATYYRIRYTNQLASPPFRITALSDPALAPAITTFPDPSGIQAIVQQARANGAAIVDFTFGAFGPDPAASTIYLYDLRTQNLSSTATDGLDFSLAYSLPLTGGSIDARIDVTKVLNFETSLTSTAPKIQQIDTVGFPASFRARGQLGWSGRDLSVTVVGNYVGSYEDTSAPTPERVSAFLTFDLTAQFTLPNESGPLRGISVAAALSNIFDRKPPYVENGAAQNFNGFHYDPANASPLGRYINVSIKKVW